MRIFQINIFGNLSTGRIATDLYRSLKQHGHEGLIAFARNSIDADIPHIRIGSKVDVLLHGILTRITDRTGFFSARSTRKLIKQIEEYKPDIIHLHNLHGYYINIKVLFEYLKKTQIPVVWTLHDCWSYTGHCCYYSVAQCSKWLSGCKSCPQTGKYPASLIMDQSARNYAQKKELFTGVNMTLVPVSYWLGEEVKKSFLKDYPIEVVQNGIDVNVFKPTSNHVKQRYGIKNKLILAVSSSWHDPRKGLADIIELAGKLPEEYQIMIVGIGGKEKDKVPSSVICIERTDSVKELAELYSAADVFVNASVEETFGLPTVEAMACATPVIVYNATAIPEVVAADCGFVVPPNDIEAIISCIPKCDGIQAERLIRNAQRFSKDNMLDHYLKIYEKLV